VQADLRVSVEAKETSKKSFLAEKDKIIASLERLQRKVNKDTFCQRNLNSLFSSFCTKIQSMQDGGLLNPPPEARDVPFLFFFT
jgi:hypothetical protein